MDASKLGGTPEVKKSKITTSLATFEEAKPKQSTNKIQVVRFFNGVAEHELQSQKVESTATEEDKEAADKKGKLQRLLAKRQMEQ